MRYFWVTPHNCLFVILPPKRSEMPRLEPLSIDSYGDDARPYQKRMRMRRAVSFSCVRVRALSYIPEFPYPETFRFSAQVLLFFTSFLSCSFSLSFLLLLSLFDLLYFSTRMCFAHLTLFFTFTYYGSSSVCFSFSSVFLVYNPSNDTPSSHSIFRGYPHPIISFSPILLLYFSPNLLFLYPPSHLFCCLFNPSFPSHRIASHLIRLYRINLLSSPHPSSALG
jgi:hypothetical protein